LTYLGLVWSGCWSSKGRTILTFLAIVTAFFLFATLQGINIGVSSLLGFLSQERLRVVAHGSSDRLPIAHVDAIASLPGVAHVSPFRPMRGYYQQPVESLQALGVDVEQWFRIYPEFRVAPGALEAMRQIRDGALVGDVVARKYAWKVGQRIPLSTRVQKRDGSRVWDPQIVGIYSIEGGGRDIATNLLLNYVYMDEARVKDKSQVAQVVVRVADASTSGELARSIDARFANSAHQTSTQNEKEFVQANLAQFGNVNLIMNSIVGAVFFVLLFMTGNTIAQSFRERIPEFGILKTLGFSNWRVMGLVLTESIMLSLAAALVGLVAAYFAFGPLMWRIGPSAGLEGVRIPASVFVSGSLLALLLALVCALLPGWHAKRLQIVDALAGR